MDIRHHADSGVPEQWIPEEISNGPYGLVLHVLRINDAVFAIFPLQRKDIAPFDCFHKFLVLLNLSPSGDEIEIVVPCLAIAGFLGRYDEMRNAFNVSIR
jgi:hypothetical protein